MKRITPCLVAMVLASALSTRSIAADLVAACLECHHPGEARGAVPLIEGQQESYLRHQLARFRDRHRDEFPMSALAKGFDDDAIDRIARALAARRWRPAPGAIDTAAAAAGRTRAAQLACADCHGADYAGTGDIPRLAGQEPLYLRSELAKFGAGERYHPPSGAGVRLYVLSEQDVNALAEYLHSVGVGR